MGAYEAWGHSGQDISTRSTRAPRGTGGVSRARRKEERTHPAEGQAVARPTSLLSFLFKLDHNIWGKKINQLLRHHPSLKELWAWSCLLRIRSLHAQLRRIQSQKIRAESSKPAITSAVGAQFSVSNLHIQLDQTGSEPTETGNTATSSPIFQFNNQLHPPTPDHLGNVVRYSYLGTKTSL